jgi:hypothetical protein
VTAAVKKKGDAGVKVRLWVVEVGGRSQTRFPLAAWPRATRALPAQIPQAGAATALISPASTSNLVHEPVHDSLRRPLDANYQALRYCGRSRRYLATWSSRRPSDVAPKRLTCYAPTRPARLWQAVGRSPGSADERALHMRAFIHSHAYSLTVRSTLSAIARSLFHCPVGKSDRRFGARAP